MIRYILYLLTLTLLAITACVPATQLNQQSAPLPSGAPMQTVVPVTLAFPTLDPSTLLASPSGHGDASRVNDAVRELKTRMREASGLRAKLGPQADEFFRLIDQAETAAVQDLLRQMQGNSKPLGMPALLPPRTGSTLGAYQFSGLGSVFVALMAAPDLVQRPDYARGVRDKPLSVKENDETLGDNIRAHAKVETQVKGSRAELDVKLTIRGEQNGMVYEENWHGKISLPICPDKEGKVPVDLYLEVSGGISAVGYQFQTDSTNHGVGLVDDDANLVSIEQDVQMSASLQSAVDAVTSQRNSDVKGGMRLTMIGVNTENPSFANAKEEWRGTPQQDNLAYKLGLVGLGMSPTLERMALQKAEEKWKDGYCVAVRVDDEHQDVMAGSETSFIARLQHQFEGMEMNLPIIATLKSGAVAVTPSGVKVPAGATFRYKAPDTSGQEATVELISRSRRGIGKLDVTFMTQVPYYRVDARIGQPKVKLFGDICALDKPFKLSVNGRNAASGEYAGDMTFTPTGESGGNVKHTASSCLPGSGCAKCFASGTYQVVGVADGKPVLMIDAYNGGCEFKGYSATYGGSTEQIELNPATGECSAE